MYGPADGISNLAERIWKSSPILASSSGRCATGVSRIARAQAYPTRPVRIILGFPAGSGSDIIARLLGQWL
jgi:tripartite-type tricarboxylate transporter receptor subunit TctC